MAISTINQAGLNAPLTLTAPVINTVTSAASTALTLQSAGTTAVTIDTSQNVGIGTTSPSSSQVGPTLQLGSASGANNQGNLRIAHNNVSLGNARAFDIYVSDNDDLTFKDGSSNTNLMTLVHSSAGGNLCVNTTSALTVGKVSVLFNGQAENGIVLKTSYASTGSDFARFYNSAGTETGSITQNGTTTTSFVTSSDYRLKENVAPMVGALATVAQLKPVTYKWKADGSDGQGFIAHELQAIVPDCVTGEKDAVDEEGNPKYQGIDTSFLVATLTAAIQEQQAMITALQADVQALKAGK